MLSFFRAKPGRSTRRRQQTRSQAIPAVETLEARNLLDAAGFVRGLYVDILHRAGSDAEVNGWVSTLQRGGRSDDVVRAFNESPERHAIEIEADYSKLLGRTAASDEVQGWVRQMANGMTHEQVEAAFLSSPEYLHKHGDTAEGLLDGLYQDVLERGADAAGKSSWADRLHHGMPASAVAAAFVASHERHDLDVNEEFQEVLHRAPDDGGRQSWVEAMDHGMHQDDLREHLVESQEFGDDHGFHDS